MAAAAVHDAGDNYVLDYRLGLIISILKIQVKLFSNLVFFQAKAASIEAVE